MQRVNCENGGDKSAPPQTTGCALEKREEQNNGDAVKKNVHKMMRPRFQTKKLAIEHVRHRRQWMPVLGMNVSKRPQNRMPVQSRLNVFVFENVNPVVVIHEVMTERLSKNGKRDPD